MLSFKGTTITLLMLTMFFFLPAQEENRALILADRYLTEVDSLNKNGLFDVSIANLKKAIQIYELSSDNYRLANALEILGNTYMSSGVNEKSIIHYNRALKIMNTLEKKDDARLSSLYRSLGYSHWSQLEFLVAIEYLEKAIALLQNDPEKNQIGLGDAYIYLALVHQEMGNYDLAIEKIENAKRIFEAVSGKEGYKQWESMILKRLTFIMN